MIPDNKFHVRALVRLLGRVVLGVWREMMDCINNNRDKKPNLVSHVSACIRSTRVRLALTLIGSSAWFLAGTSWASTADDYTAGVEVPALSLGFEDDARLSTGPLKPQALRDGSKAEEGKAGTSPLRQVKQSQSGPVASFVQAPDSYTIGSGQDIAVSVSGQLPKDAFVLALSWSFDERAMQDQFATKIDPQNPVILSEKLDQLPTGKNQLQLIIHSPSEGTLSRVVHNIDVKQPAPARNIRNFSYDFGDLPVSFTLGSDVDLELDVQGELPDGGDLLVLAWSSAEKRMVDEFAFALTQEPWVIPAEQLNKLPAGDVTLQLLYRESNKTKGKKSHDISIEQPLPTLSLTGLVERFVSGDAPGVTVNIDGELPAGSELTASVVSRNDDGTVFDQSLAVGATSIDASKLGGLEAGDYRLNVVLKLDGEELVRVSGDFGVEPAPVPAAVDYAAQRPVKIVQGDGQTVGYEVTGDVVDGHDLVVQAWSIDQQKLVDNFAYRTAAVSGEITSDRLARLPGGEVVLQVLLRLDNQVVDKTSHRLAVEVPVPEVTETPVEPAVSFNNAPTEMTRGEAVTLAYEVDVEGDADLLVQAWSITESKQVEGFAHTVEASAGAVSASRLAALPAGDYVIQLILRDGDHQPLASTDHRLAVVEPVSTEPEPEPEPATDPQSESDTGEPAETTGDDSTQVEVEPAILGGAFVGAPTTYNVGQASAITLGVSNAPSQGRVDAVIQVWSIDEARLIDSASHVISAEDNWSVDTGKLDTLPAGQVVLQALLRVDYQVQTRVSHNMDVVLPQTSSPSPDDETDATTDPQSDGSVDQPDSTESDTTTDGTGSEADTSGDDVSGDGSVVEIPDLGEVSTGFTSIEPDTDAVYLSNDASRNQIQAALDTGRDVMFPAGGVFSVNNLSLGSGGTADNPRLLGVYGEGPRPLLRVDGNANGLFCIGSSPKTVSHVVIQGLDFYSHERDYHANPGVGNADGVQYGIAWMMPGEGLRIEDCRFRYFEQAVHIAGLKDAYESPQNPVIHRCIFAWSWGGQRAIGVSTDTPRTGKGITITDTVFYHNGWREGGERSRQAHNIYIDDNYLRYVDHGSPSAPTHISGVISIAGSSHGMKDHPGGIVEDSLFARNAIAFFVSGNDSTVRRNVVLQSTDLDSSDPLKQLGRGIEAFWMDKVVFESNVIANRDSAGAGEALTSSANTTTLLDNTVWDWKNGWGSYIRVTGAIETEQNSITNDSGILLTDPDRDLGDYAQTIGLADGEDALIQEMLNRPRGVWYDDLDARTINQYIREGFQPVDEALAEQVSQTLDVELDAELNVPLF